MYENTSVPTSQALQAAPTFDLNLKETLIADRIRRGLSTLAELRNLTEDCSHIDLLEAELTGFMSRLAVVANQYDGDEKAAMQAVESLEGDLSSVIFAR